MPKTKAKELANAMKEACANDNIGYNQEKNARLGVFRAVKFGTKIANISEPTDCDCSGLVLACILQAFGVELANFNTSSEPSVLEKSGLFEDPVEIKSEADLKAGMILVTKTKGHTVIVTEVSGTTKNTKKEEPKKETAAKSDVPYKVKVTATDLNIRQKATTDSRVTGHIVDKGVYTIVEENGVWGKLKSGAGWICLNYTKRI